MPGNEKRSSHQLLVWFFWDAVVFLLNNYIRTVGITLCNLVTYYKLNRSQGKSLRIGMQRNIFFYIFLCLVNSFISLCDLKSIRKSGVFYEKWWIEIKNGGYHVRGKCEIFESGKGHNIKYESNKQLKIHLSTNLVVSRVCFSSFSLNIL